MHEVDVDANPRCRGPRDVYELTPMLDAADACSDRRGRDDAELARAGADVQDVCPRSTTEELRCTYRDLDRRPMHARHASHDEREHVIELAIEERRAAPQYVPYFPGAAHGSSSGSGKRWRTTFSRVARVTSSPSSSQYLSLAPLALFRQARSHAEPASSTCTRS